MHKRLLRIVYGEEGDRGGVEEEETKEYFCCVYILAFFFIFDMLSGS